MEYISEAEFYHRLAELRDIYLSDDIERQRDVTVEIYQNYKRMFDKLVQEYDKTRSGIQKTFEDIVKNTTTSMKAIEQAEQKMAEKFAKVDYLIKSEEKTFEDWGRSAVLETQSLWDFAEQYKQIQEYWDLMKQIKEIGAPKDFMFMIKDFDIEQGLQYMKDLISMTPEEFSKTIGDWLSVNSISQTFAEWFNEDEMKEAVDKAKEDMAAAMSDVPEDFQDTGKNAMKLFLEGLQGGADNIITFLEGLSDNISEIFGKPFGSFEEFMESIKGTDLYKGITQSIQNASVAGANQTINVSITGNQFTGTPEEIAEFVTEKIARELRAQG
jgi:hypothetical protein